MKLIIAEKPSLAMNVVKAISNMNKNDGYFQNENYIVTFAYGHLLRLYDVDEYFNRDKMSWSLEELPFIPKDFKFKIADNSGVKKQYNVIKSLIKRNTVDEIINCGDADREGEVIINNIVYRVFQEENISKPIKRLWLPEQTPNTIKKGLKELQDDLLYKNLYNEGLARTYLDWTYGINLTRYLSLKTSALLPVGRVLIPIVKFIYDRDEEIAHFYPKTYFEIGTNIIKGNVLIKTKLKDRKFEEGEREKAKELLSSLENKKAIVDKVEKKEVKRQPPKLFSLDTLQNKMFRNERMSLDNTLANLQKLYEAGYTTYPRTNSEYIGEDEKGKVKSVIKAIKDKFNVNIEFKDSKKIFDSSKVESHSAIIPTIKIPEEDKLSEGEKKVYAAVKNRFIANFISEESIVAETHIVIKIGNEVVELKGNVIKQQGFFKYEKAKKDNELPEFSEGENLDISFSLDKKETQKPKAVTEDELNGFLKNPFKKNEVESLESENDDEEYKAILEGCEIGTVATRASIIENAKRYEYIKNSKGHLSCSTKGKKLIEALEKLNIDLSKEKTVQFGKNLKKIYRGEIEINNLLDSVKNELNTVIKNGNDVEVEKIERNVVKIGKCPLCGKGDVVSNKKGYGCNRYKEGCKFFIGNKIAGKTISEAVVKKLIKDKKTNEIKGFTGKSGKKFDACLKIEGDKVIFDFGTKDKQSFGKCPVCKQGDITANKSGYGCNRWKEGCKFFIGSKIAGKTISQKTVKELIQGKVTDTIKGFTNKSGKEFDARLKLQNGQVKFDFNK